MPAHGEHPNPLEYRQDDPAPAGLWNWLIVLVVWAVGLVSWSFWTAIFVYGFFKFFGPAR